jgi:hypothetical protein
MTGKAFGFGYGLVCRPAGPVAIARWMEFRLENGLKNVQQGLLYHPVFDRGYAQRTFAPIFFVDVNPFYCLWRVSAISQLFMDLAQVCR